MLYFLMFLLVVAIVFLQMRQGLFSSLVMAALTTVSAILTFMSFDYLASATGLREAAPSIAEGICISVVFGASLFIMRFAADRLIKADIFFDTMVDRIGGGACGLITGITMAGILALTLQTLPFGRSILGYEPFNDDLQRAAYLHPFYPDDYLLALGNTCTTGSMSGGGVFEHRHPDFLRELFCWRNRAGRCPIVTSPPGTIKVRKLYALDGTSLADKNKDKDLVDVVVRIGVNGSAAYVPPPGKNKRRRNKGWWWRLPATHFRLVCRSEENNTEKLEGFYPWSYLFYDNDTPKLALSAGNTDPDPIPKGALAVERNSKAAFYDPERKKYRSDKTDLVVDWVYRIPAGAVPLRLEFRRSAYAKISVALKKPDDKSKEIQKPVFSLDPLPLNDSAFKQYALKYNPRKRD